MPINNSFGGFMSSVAMFSNSLSAAQLENLWIAGVSNGAVPYPFITAQPNPTNIELLSPGGVFSLSASAFGVQPCSGYWQYNSGSGWVTVSSADVSAPSVNTLLSNTLEVGTLMFTNYQAGDNGSYRLVVSNSNAGQLQWVTSSVVSITNFTITSGTFAAALTNPALGTMAFWPLNETIDPSTGKTGPAVIAYDIIGGFNGVYGTNADNGAGNSFYSLPALAGPGANGYPGLPAQGALGVTNSSVFSNSYVSVAMGPTFPSNGGNTVPNTTNATVIAWVFTEAAGQAAYTGLIDTANNGVDRVGCSLTNLGTRMRSAPCGITGLSLAMPSLRPFPPTSGPWWA